MGAVERRQLAAWIVLVAATFLSVRVAVHFDAQVAAIAVGLLIAAGKVILVLHRFMHGERLRMPMKIFFLVWTIGCAAMIIGFAAAS